VDVSGVTGGGMSTHLLASSWVCTNLKSVHALVRRKRLEVSFVLCTATSNSDTTAHMRARALPV